MCFVFVGCVCVMACSESSPSFVIPFSDEARMRICSAIWTK